MSTGKSTRPLRVLVPLDGSPAAATVLPMARAVAKQLDARVEVLHVASEEPPDPELWRRLHEDVDGVASVLMRSHAGEPADVILGEAATSDVALVVLATHGQAVQPGRNLGRVAQSIIARTTHPILLVRPEVAKARIRPNPLRRLLLPVDGSPATATALVPATEIASRLGASIDLLYVAGSEAPHEDPVAGSIGAPRYVDQAQHEWPGWAREVLDRLCTCLANCPTNVPVRMSLARGRIGQEIARFAREHHDDVIVLVRRSHLEAGRARALRAVLALTPCPVLLLSGDGSLVGATGQRTMNAA